MKRSTISVLMTVITVAPYSVAAASPIDDFIRQLNYDPRALLAVSEPGSTESLPGRTNGRNGVIICTNKPQGLTESLDEVTILSPLTGVVFPGALIRANRALADGKPDPLSLPRAPVTITLNLHTFKGASRTVANPTYSTVQAATDELLASWFAHDQPAGFTNAAQASYNVQKAYSQTQLALSLGFGTKWSNNAITANLKVNSNAETSTTVKLFRQVFYTVAMDPLERPSAVFARSVTPGDLAHLLNADNAPAYIRSVDYGRIVLVRMDTSSAETEADLKAALNYVTQSGTEVNGQTDNKIKRIVGESRFTVLTLGGNAQVAAQTFDPNNLDKIQQVIVENATFKVDNPAYPIAYTAAFLKDNALATITFSTSYTKSDCVSYPNGFVTLQNSGGYVGRFFVDWAQKAADGVNDETKSWESGNVTAGWRATRDIPGDASKVHIKAEAATGLFWQPWNEALDKTLNGPDNKCYRITGTTLSPHWDNDC